MTAIRKFRCEYTYEQWCTYYCRCNRNTFFRGRREELFSPTETKTNPFKWNWYIFPRNPSIPTREYWIPHPEMYFFFNHKRVCATNSFSINYDLEMWCGLGASPRKNVLLHLPDVYCALSKNRLVFFGVKFSESTKKWIFQQVLNMQTYRYTHIGQMCKRGYTIIMTMLRVRFRSEEPDF